jgi:hypothetical protein
VYAGTLAWRAEDAASVLSAWADWTNDLDDRVTSIIRFLNLPPIPEIPETFRGRRMVTLGVVGVEDLDAAETTVDRMRRVAPLELDHFESMSPAGLVRLHGDPEGPTSGMSHHALLSKFDDQVAQRFVEVAGAGSDSSLLSVEVRHLGGAVGRPIDGGGVVDHISAPYVLNAVGMAADPEQQSATWGELSHVVDAMTPWNAGVYLNFSERADRDVFDHDTIERLADVKLRVDPDNRFADRADVPVSGQRS